MLPPHPPSSPPKGFFGWVGSNKQLWGDNSRDNTIYALMPMPCHALPYLAAYSVLRSMQTNAEPAPPNEQGEIFNALAPP